MLSSSMCFNCKHIHLKLERDDKGATCDAFPDGIPDEIFLNKFEHTKPYPGDHGIRFEPTEKYRKFLEDFRRKYPDAPDVSMEEIQKIIRERF